MSSIVGELHVRSLVSTYARCQGNWTDKPGMYRFDGKPWEDDEKRDPDSAAKKQKTGDDAPTIVVSDSEEASASGAPPPQVAEPPRPPQVQAFMDLAAALETEADNLAAQREADSPL